MQGARRRRCAGEDRWERKGTRERDEDEDDGGGAALVRTGLGRIQGLGMR